MVFLEGVDENEWNSAVATKGKVLQCWKLFDQFDHIDGTSYSQERDADLCEEMYLRSR